MPDNLLSAHENSQATHNILLHYEENAFATDRQTNKTKRGWERETLVNPQSKKINKNSPQPSISDTRCANVHMA